MPPFTPPPPGPTHTQMCTHLSANHISQAMPSPVTVLSLLSLSPPPLAVHLVSHSKQQLKPFSDLGEGGTGGGGGGGGGGQCYKRYFKAPELCSNTFSVACAGLRPSRGVEDEEVQAAKRPRLMLPDYGRSASDPPLSFQRRNAHAMNVPVETLRLAAAKPAAAQMPKTLRSFQSGPARSAAQP